MKGGTMRGRIFLAVKVVVTIAMVAFLFSRIPLRDVEAAMHTPHWGWLFVSFAIYAISAVAGAWQWALILRAMGIVASWRELGRLYFIGLFFNNFLPANVGGDAWKILDLGARDGRRAGVLGATLLDRLIGLAALTVLAIMVMAVAAARAVSLPESTLLLLPVGVLLFGVLAALLSRRLGALLIRATHRVGLTRLARPMEDFVADLALVRPRVAWLNGIFGLSTGIQLLRMLTHLAAARGLGFALDLNASMQLLVLIPLLALSLTLPISINGIGLRESLSASMLVWAGLTAPQAVAMELVAYLVQVAFSLQGGVLLWLGRGRGRRNGRNGAPAREPAPGNS